MTAQVEGLRRFMGARRPAPWQPSEVPVLIVAGATGGAGASTVTALLGLVMSQEGRRTLLIDTDEMVGALHRILGIPAPAGLSALLDHQRTLADLLVPVSEGCALLPGGEPPEARSVPFDATARRSVMRRIGQSYTEFDAVVIDAGSRADLILAAGDAGVRRILLVAGATPVAIASAYAVLKTAEARWPGVTVDVLFNRLSPEAGRTAFALVEQAASTFLHRTIAFAGVLPDDPSVTTAPDLPLHRCSRATSLALQQLAASLLTDPSSAAGA